MHSINLSRTRSGLLPVCLMTFALAACGGGGGGDGKSSGGVGVTPATNTPTSTRTLRPGAPTLTPVRTATATPTIPVDTPTPTPTFIEVDPGTRSIVEAVRAASDGAIVVVPAGTYEPFTLTASDVNGAITLFADTTGLDTGGAAGPVIINGHGNSPAIVLDGVSDLLIDGFTITGGSTAGIEIRNSGGITVADCIVRGNQADGVRFIESASNLVFNNLIYNNQRAGLSVVGTSDLQIINNTIYGNGAQGISVGDSLLPSDTIFLRNNILSDNKARGIVMHASTSGIDSDYNLNRDGYGTSTPVGAHDFNGDPFFNNAGTDNGFRLPPTTEDCIGGSVATDGGDPATDADLAGLLGELTTQTDQKLDCIGEGCCPSGCSADGVPACTKIGRPDVGYHYPAP